MPDINIENQKKEEQSKVEERNETNCPSEKKRKYKYVGTFSLIDNDINDILRDIEKRIRNKRRLVIPVGSSGTGKTMFIASLIAYAYRKDEKIDKSLNFSKEIPDNESGVESILKTLDTSKVLKSTTKGYCTIIDLNMMSTHRKMTEENNVKITLVDFAGEDIESLMNNQPNECSGKVLSILKSCIVQKAIWAMLTPVDEDMENDLERTDFDDEQDRAMINFINQVRTSNSKLFNGTKKLIIVNKWDKVSDEKMSCQKFLEKHRPSLFTEYLTNSYSLLKYTIGNVNEQIISIDLRAPKNFWFTLYKWCTGKSVIPWLKRIL